MLSALLCLGMAVLAWLAAWASWPNSQGLSVLLGMIGGLATVMAVFALVWTG
jgi:hypothetical protein